MIVCLVIARLGIPKLRLLGAFEVCLLNIAITSLHDPDHNTMQIRIYEPSPTSCA